MYVDETRKALTQAVDKLTAKLEQAENRLTYEENRAKGWSPRKCNALRKEIESLNQRLDRAFNLLEKTP